MWRVVGPVPGEDSPGTIRFLARWTPDIEPTCYRGEYGMGRAALLWLLGVPIPVLLLMWALGWLH
jgi:hypothetical protein